jgi:hypothetical protein
VKGEKMKVQKDVLDAFNLNGNIESLSGGQNTSVRVNDAVLKPIDDVSHYEWLLNIISGITPQQYRLSKPIKSNDGTFIYNGWCCTRYEPGKNKEGNVKQKLHVSRLFHNDLAKKTFDNMPKIDNPWSKSDLIAWQKEKLPQNLSKQTINKLEELLRRVRLKEHYKVPRELHPLTYCELSHPRHMPFQPQYEPSQHHLLQLRLKLQATQPTRRILLLQ